MVPDTGALLGIFAASLAGSVHCAGMCGGLVLAATGSRLSSQWVYHVSRLMGYLTLGALSGFLGSTLMKGDWEWLPYRILLSSFFLTMLIVFIFRDALQRRAARISQAGMRLGLRWFGSESLIWRPGLTGLFTVFLPCGWLYGFIGVALASHSVLSGIAILTVFWLGTIPALFGSRVLIQTVFAKLGIRGSRWVAGIMVGASLLSFMGHWRGVFNAKSESHVLEHTCVVPFRLPSN